MDYHHENHLRRKIFLIALSVLVITACGLPGLTQPTPFVFPSATPLPVVDTMLPPGAFNPTATQPGATGQPQPAVTVLVVTATLPPNSTDTPQPSATATQIPSSTPTFTPPATSTRTPLPGANASATYLNSHPVIDGVWDEWTTTQYPLDNVVWGRSSWSGQNDLLASYRIGWDNNYLYLAVKVHDDKYGQVSNGSKLYLGDSIELLLSTKPSADSANLGLTSHDYQLGISPGHDKIGHDMEAYLWFPEAKQDSLDNVSIGAVTMQDGYRVEAAIPWSVFDITPSRGQVFGFAVSVSDDDHEDHAEQQSMISSSPLRNLSDPTTWGALILK